jgi:hypothetical protein
MGNSVAAPTIAQSNLAGGAASIRNWPRFALLATPLIGATFLSKFAFPPFGKQGLGISIFLVIAALLAGAFGGYIRVEPRRLTFYVTMIGLLGLIQILQPDVFSPLSLLLLVAVHLPYIFDVPHSDDGGRIIKFFLGIATVFALLGIAQYSLQFFISPRYLFPIENFVPDTFIVQRFNHQAAMEYASEEYRANGVFLLEPSFFSQLLAIAIVAELCTLGRLSRIVLFGLVLAICLPLCLVAQRRWGLLLLAAIGLIAMLAAHEYLHVGRLLSRVGEFSSIRSSGYARFIGGFYLFDYFLWHDAWRTLFGYGAGAFTNYVDRAHYGAGEMALFKIVFEFGLIGAVAYFGFLFACLYYSPAPRLLTLAVGITYLLSGIYIPFAHGMALSLLLWNWAPATVGRGEWLGKFTQRGSMTNPATALLTARVRG